MKYQAIPPLARRDAEKALGSSARDDVVRALLSLALYDDDWRWVQEKCVECSAHTDVWVRRASATGLLHIARLHGQLDSAAAAVVFRRLRADPETADEVPHMIAEIEAFLRNADET